MGNRKKTAKYWFPHDYGASNDYKLKIYESKFHLKGYAIFFKLVEITPELDEFSINFQPNSDDLYFISRYVGIKKSELMPFLTGMIECGLLIEDEKGNYYNPRVKEHILESLGKEIHYKIGNTGKNVNKSETNLLQICNKSEKKPKLERQDKAVILTDDVELSSNGKLIKHAIDTIIHEAKDNLVNKSKHKNSDLLNSQIEKLIKEHTYPVVLIAVKAFYLWKVEKPESKLKFSSDYGSITKQFISQAKTESATKQITNKRDFQNIDYSEIPEQPEGNRELAKRIKPS